MTNLENLAVEQMIREKEADKPDWKGIWNFFNVFVLDANLFNSR